MNPKQADLFTFSRAPSGTRNFAGSSAKAATPPSGLCPRCIVNERGLTKSGRRSGYCLPCRKDYAKQRKSGELVRKYQGDGLCRMCGLRERYRLGPNAKHAGKLMSYCAECQKSRAKTWASRTGADPTAQRPKKSQAEKASALRARRETNWKNRSREFWSLVEKTDGCWLWRGAVGVRGYGTFGITSRDGAIRERGAHRVSCWLSSGTPPGNLFVCHRCDVPLCVNPAHLFLGTHHDNMLDAEMKGRTGGMRILAERHGLSLAELLAAVAAAGRK